MDLFEEALSALARERPVSVVFDLSEADFISVGGYVAIGRCSLAMKVIVQSTGNLPEDVLRHLGYRDITYSRIDSASAHG